VLINPHSLQLLTRDSGPGRKLVKKYDGPFEITHKLSPTTYRLRLPSSYRMHPVLNISHLELYRESPEKLGPHSTIPISRAEGAAQEWEVDHIVAETRRKRGNRRIPYYRVRYTGFGPEWDEWIPRSYLRNAPDILRDWETGLKGAQNSSKKFN
jgi:hypothetical protein